MKNYIITPLITIFSCTVASSQLWIDSLDTTPLYIPNSFTPDGDNVNDAWKTFSDNEWDEFLVEVYNCWGECIWYSTDPGEWWMGEGDIEKPNYYAINGTYYYTVNARKDDEYFSKKGSINKLR